jgi:hypothetical protein
VRYIVRMLRKSGQVDNKSAGRFGAALKLALVALFLFVTGGPAVIAQYDEKSAAGFWLQERVRQQKQAAQKVVQRPTHLIRRAAPRKGFTVEVPADQIPQPVLDADGNPVMGPDGQPLMTTPPPPVQAEAPAVPARPVDPTFFVAVLGDNIGQLLGQGLTESFTDKPDISILRRAKENTGLVRDDYYDWLKASRELLNGPQKISAAVMMIGSNDRQQIRENGAFLDARSPRWKEVYGARITAIASLFKEKNVPLIWVGMPVMKNERLSADFIDFNEIYRESAEKAGATYIDVWDAFVDDRGQFSLYGPDVNGQTAKLRTGDGIHFTKQGARKLAHFVEIDLRRIYDDAHQQSSPAVAALPAPAPANPASPTAPSAPGAPQTAAAPVAPVVPQRPAAGPVIPLTTPAVSPGGVLATRIRPPAATSEQQRLVERVLVQGAPPEPRPGRADDFGWPRL